MDPWHYDPACDLNQSMVERLQRYKLRANAEILDASSDYTVAAIWGGPYEPHGEGKQPVWFADPRLPDMGFRELVTIGSDWALAGESADSATPDDYHAHRIALGVPEGGKDFELGDTYPHEALFDQLNGVSFEKGCYVGQEVVSRVEHRGTARKRVMTVTYQDYAPEAGVPVKVGDTDVGVMGSSTEGRGLAMLHLGRIGDALASGQPILSGGIAIQPVKPAWARFDWPGDAKAAE